jgi:hypothetical protein
MSMSPEQIDWAEIIEVFILIVLIGSYARRNAIMMRDVWLGHMFDPGFKILPEPNVG